jgi:arabinose-5-phosphate isomerase
MSNALIIMNKFNQGVLIVRNKNKQTLGIISDGDIKRISNKNNDIKKLIAKKIMKKNPITVDKNMIAAEALSIMNSKKVTCLCVHDKKNKRKTLGIITVHNILNANIQ